MVLVTFVRRHLSGAIGLLLALATGIALGAGPLSGESLRDVTTAPAAAPSDVDSGPDADELARAVAPALTEGRLQGRSVALLTTPGVAATTVEDLTAAIEQADGAVAAHWSAGSSLVGAGEKALVDTLGEQLVDQLEGRGADADAVAYERMGQLLGTAIATRESQGLAPGADSQTIRQSIDAASLLSQDGGTPRRAPLVLVVLGDDLDDDVLAGLLEGLASRAAGVVVAGPEDSDDVEVAAGLETVSTVDGVGEDVGRLAAVLALSGVEQEPGGSFGMSGSDGLLPLG